MTSGVVGTREICCVKGCEELSHARSLCAFHYKRLEAGKPINGKNNSRRSIGTGCINITGSAVSGKLYSIFEVMWDKVKYRSGMHRVIAQYAIKTLIPKEWEVHHIDGDSLNNTPSNLAITKSKRIHNELEALAKKGIMPESSDDVILVGESLVDDFNEEIAIEWWLLQMRAKHDEYPASATTTTFERRGL